MAAWSGGWLWIPRNPLAKAAGIDEDPETPRAYLRHELGDGYDEARVAMFFEQGPRIMQTDALGLAAGARDRGAGLGGNQSNQIGKRFHGRGIMVRAHAKA